MHEFAICQRLVSTALKELDRVGEKGLRLTRVNVVAGQYHGIIPGSLKLAYKLMTKDTPAEGSTIKIRNVPLEITCRNCGWRGKARDFMSVCRKCRSACVDITGGKDLFLESIVVDKKRTVSHRAHRARKGR